MDERTCEYCGLAAYDVQMVADDDDNSVLLLCEACREILSVEEL